MLRYGERRVIRGITILIGVVEGLLIARLMLRLFAARPDNAVIQALYGVTQPLIAPLGALDSAQPRYGASLEFATLTLIVALPLLTMLFWRLTATAQIGRRV